MNRRGEVVCGNDSLKPALALYRELGGGAVLPGGRDRPSTSYIVSSDRKAYSASLKELSRFAAVPKLPN
jgi:hypothetical protein